MRGAGDDVHGERLILYDLVDQRGIHLTETLGVSFVSTTFA
jgi:hypothetical protein